MLKILILTILFIIGAVLIFVLYCALVIADYADINDDDSGLDDEIYRE